jgi:hypothetical protein
MNAAIGFLHFWYDFIVGDAWEVAAGVLIGLVLTWAIQQSGAHSLAWLTLPVAVVGTLGGSLLLQARRVSAG